jgi:hypothetical protein
MQGQTEYYIVLAHGNDIDGQAHWVIYNGLDAARRAAESLRSEWPYTAIRPVGRIIN